MQETGREREEPADLKNDKDNNNNNDMQETGREREEPADLNQVHSVC